MRGLDTNVLLRYLTADDPAQSTVARELLERAEDAQDRFYISTVVLCELSWTLRGKPYQLDRQALSRVIENLLGASLLEIQDRDLAWSALEDYRAGHADFPDYLLGRQNRRAGCRDTVTFDRKLADAPGFTLLPEPAR